MTRQFLWMSSTLCGLLMVGTASAQTMIDGFEYASDAELQAAWVPGVSTIGLSPNVAQGAAGTNSMSITRTFASAAWEAEFISAQIRSTALSISNNQYVTLRVAGDPQFTNATFRLMYVYAYDSTGNFGRWGSLVPTTTNWTVLNMLAANIARPWDSPGLPDLADIVRFKLVIIGQSATPGPEYTATIYVDDLAIRDTPLYPSSSGGQTMVQDFEYASDAELLAAWQPYTGTLSVSPYVASGSSGTKSVRLDRYFTTGDWDTESMTGPQLPAALAIKPSQYITIRLTGDPQFTNGTYTVLYVYAFDANGNFGRWGSAVPTSGTNWQILNFLASSIGKPWNSTALPELNNIVQFSLYLYGQGSPAGPAYSATLYVDDLMVRDAPLVEFPAPSPVRGLIDDFEAYANDAALTSFYSYVNSPATTATAASLASPAPQGNKALKLAIDFASGQYPWGSVLSSTVSPFSFPTNGVVQFRFKGDAALAPVVDDATSFWLSFYDDAGRAIHCSGLSAAVGTAEWVTVNAGYADFWSGTAVDTGNLVRWRLLVQGWEGTAESSPLSGAFYVDDIRIIVQPALAIVQEGGSLKLQMSNLIPGTTYTLRQTTNFTAWTTTSIQATGTTLTWTVPPGQKSFYQLYYTP